MKNTYPFILLIVFVYYFTGCSAVPIEDRYKRTSGERSFEKKDTVQLAVTPAFDLTKYRTKLDLSDSRVEIITSAKEEKHSDGNYKLKEETKTNGYRVLMLSTDKLDEAESLRAELYFKANLHKIYIDFESPFYKVKVGDYLNMTDAKEMVFKLSQLGYSSLLIISDTVNSYR
jgi:cell division protein FtsN